MAMRFTRTLVTSGDIIVTIPYLNNDTFTVHGPTAIISIGSIFRTLTPEKEEEFLDKLDELCAQYAD